MRLIDADVLKTNIQQARIDVLQATGGGKYTTIAVLNIFEEYINKTPTVDAVFCTNCGGLMKKERSRG